MNGIHARRPALLFPILALLLVAGIFASKVITADAADPTAAISASPNPLTYDDVAVGQSKDATITVRSSGTAPLAIASVSNFGRDAGDFNIVDDRCTGQTVAPGASCAVVLRFTPSTSTTRVTNIGIRSTNACSFYIQVAGGGTTPAATRSGRACEIVTSTVTTPATTTTTSTTVTTPGPTVTSSSAASVSPPPAATVTTPATGSVQSSTSSSSRQCKSRRTVTLHVNPKRGVKYTKIVIKRNNKTVKTFTSTAAKKVVYKLVLTGQPKTRNKVEITATTTSGKAVKRTQYFVTCVAKTSTR